MRGRSLNVHGRTSSEPRSALANSEGRMPGERAAGGVFLWLPFFARKQRSNPLACRVSGISSRKKSRSWILASPE